MPPLVVGILIGLFGLFVIARQKESSSSAVFLALTFCGTVWLFSYAGLFSATQPGPALLWARIEMVAVSFIPCLFYLFALLVTGKTKTFNLGLIGSVLVSLCFAILVMNTNLIVSGVRQFYWGYYVQFGRAGFGFILFFLTCMGGSLVLYHREWLRAVRQRHRLRYQSMLAAFGIACLGGVDFFPAYGVSIYPFGYVPVLIFLFIAAYAFERFRFVDITAGFAVDQILNTMSDSLLVLDQNGIIRIANPAACELLGKTREELTGMSIASYNRTLLTLHQLERILAGRAPKNFIISIPAGNGGEKVLNISTSVMRDAWRDPIAVICIMNDMTQIKTAESAHMQLAAIVESSDDAIIGMDLQGKVNAWNSGAQMMYGYLSEDIVGKPLDIFFPPERTGEGSHLINQIRQGVHLKNYETVHKKRDGSSFEVALTLSPVSHPFHPVSGISMIVRDITKRREAEEKFRGLLESAPDAMIIMDKDGVIALVNGQTEKLFGYSREELLGQPVDILVPQNQKTQHANLREVFLHDPHARAMGSDLDLFACKKDGTAFPVEISLSPMKTEEGMLITAALRDISERKRTLEMLRRKNMFVMLLQVVAVAANQASTIEDAIQMCIDEVCAHTGWPIGHAYLRDPGNKDRLVSLAIWHIAPPEKFEAFKQMTEITHLRGGQGLPAQVLSAEQPLWITDLPNHPYFKSSPIVAGLGLKTGYAFPVLVGKEVVAVLEFFSDKLIQPDPPLLEVMAHIGAQIGRVVERRRSEEMLRRAYDELEKRVEERTKELSKSNVLLTKAAADLERSNKELEQFAYVASHDLQEPLRMVASYVQLLKERYANRLDRDADDFIRFASEGATRAQNLIDDLLEYSRVGTRGKPFEETSLEEVFKQAAGNLKVAVEESHAVITHDPFPHVSGDFTQLVQLFQNLLGNAIKFRKGDSPRVHVSSVLRDDGEIREWVFGVKDDGIGIAPEYHERIFVIFQRLHSRDKYPGTGIGLAICKKIVERHGGRMWMESSPGNGSAFYFSVPAAGSL